MKYDTLEFKYLQRDLANKIFATNYDENIVDYVQSGGGWIKFRFRKSLKTVVLEEKHLVKSYDFTKLIENKTEIEEALQRKLGLKSVPDIRIPDASDMQNIKAGVLEMWKSSIRLFNSVEKSDPLAFVARLEPLNFKLLLPADMTGEYAGDAVYVRTGNKYAGAFRPTGFTQPGTDVQIWEKAIEPLCWYGIPAPGKLVSRLSEVNNYEAPLDNLEELIEEERR